MPQNAVLSPCLMFLEALFPSWGNRNDDDDDNNDSDDDNDNDYGNNFPDGDIAEERGLDK